MDRPSKCSVSRLVRAMIAVAALLPSTGCGTSPQAVASAEPPGTAVISYANAADKSWTTTIGSQPAASAAGVDGRVFALSAFRGRELFAHEFTVDLAGNVGLRGTIYSRSSRREKWAIRPYEGDAVGLLDRVRMVTYHYRGERASDALHIGLIAEDAPAELTGPAHDALNINNALGVDLAASQQLAAKVRSLEAQLSLMQRQIRRLEERSTAVR